MHLQSSQPPYFICLPNLWCRPLQPPTSILPQVFFFPLQLQNLTLILNLDMIFLSPLYTIITFMNLSFMIVVFCFLFFFFFFFVESDCELKLNMWIYDCIWELLMPIFDKGPNGRRSPIIEKVRRRKRYRNKKTSLVDWNGRIDG